MARKKKHGEHANHERWLVSYADFITLLFAFFVVMFAVSQVDSKKVGRFAESFRDALSYTFEEKGKGLLPGDAMPKQSNLPPGPGIGPDGGIGNSLVETQKELLRARIMKRAGKTRALAGLAILDVHGEIVLRLPERLIFPPADAALTDSGREAILAISDELAPYRNVRVRVEGHTDDRPIHTVRFPSNWDLSTARATAVVAIMVEEGRIDPRQLSAAGYGQYHPVAPNDTAEGRGQNRRVDIILVADFGPAVEQGP